MTRSLALASMMLLCLAAASGRALAQTESDAHGHSSGDEHAHETVHHRHHVGVVVGGGVHFAEDETRSGAVIALDYEYRVHSLLGVGAAVEAATGDLREVIVITPVTVHPWRGLRLIAAPGVEIRREEPAEFLFRLGIGYLFDVGRFSIGPELDVDIVQGEPTIVAGMVFGVGF